MASIAAINQPHAQVNRDRAVRRSFEKHASLSDDELLERVRPTLGRPGRPPASIEESESTRDKWVLAYRLQQRGLTYAQIAQTLESSPHSVKEWVSKAREGLKVDLRRIDILQEMGETLDFFHDARVTAMGMASDLSISPAVRVEALMAALKTERDKTDFLARAGVYSATSAECMARVIVQSLSSEHSDADKKLHDFMDKLAKDLQEAAQSRLMKAA